jgi:hypothetical protein
MLAMVRCVETWGLPWCMMKHAGIAYCLDLPNACWCWIMMMDVMTMVLVWPCMHGCMLNAHHVHNVAQHRQCVVCLHRDFSEQRCITLLIALLSVHANWSCQLQIKL